MKLSELMHNFEEFPAACAARLVEIIKVGTVKENALELIQCVASLVGWLATVIDGDSEKPIIGTDGAQQPYTGSDTQHILDVCNAAGVPVPIEASAFLPSFLRGLLIQALVKIVEGVLDELTNDKPDSEIMAAVFDLARAVLFHLASLLEDLEDEDA